MAPPLPYTLHPALFAAGLEFWNSLTLDHEQDLELAYVCPFCVGIQRAGI